MKLFEVELKMTIVVVGKSEGDAYFNAMDSMSEIKNIEEPDIDVIGEVSLKTLPATWDERCIPYGGDGNTRIEDIK